MGSGHEVRVGRVYDEAVPGDGARVLVNRIWPRGLSKERAALDEWCKQVAPSTALRKWYGHDPSLFEEFARRYRVELAEPERADAVGHLRSVAERGPLTLLTATRTPRSARRRCWLSCSRKAEVRPGGEGLLPRRLGVGRR